MANVLKQFLNNSGGSSSSSGSTNGGNSVLGQYLYGNNAGQTTTQKKKNTPIAVLNPNYKPVTQQTTATQQVQQNNGPDRGGYFLNKVNDFITESNKQYVTGKYNAKDWQQKYDYYISKLDESADQYNDQYITIGSGKTVQTVPYIQALKQMLEDTKKRMLPSSISVAGYTRTVPTDTGYKLEPGKSVNVDTRMLTNQDVDKNEVPDQWWKYTPSELTVRNSSFGRALRQKEQQLSNEAALADLAYYQSKGAPLSQYDNRTLNLLNNLYNDMQAKAKDRLPLSKRNDMSMFDVNPNAQYDTGFFDTAPESYIQPQKQPEQTPPLADAKMFATAQSKIGKETADREWQTPYSQLYTNSDFNTNSGYKKQYTQEIPTFSTAKEQQEVLKKSLWQMSADDLDNLFYESVNGNEDAFNLLYTSVNEVTGDRQHNLNVLNNDMIGTQHVDFAKGNGAEEYMTKEEVSMFNYLWNTGGKEAAIEYYNGLLEHSNNGMPSLEARRAQAINDQTAEWATENPVLSNILTTVAKPFTTGIGVVNDIYSLISTGTINPDAPAQAVLNAANIVRGTTAENITESTGSEFLGGLYQTGMSVVDNLYGMALGSSIASALGVTGKGAESIVKAVSLGLMSTDAAHTAVINNLENGLDLGSSVGLGLASGIIEYLTEKIGIDNMFNSMWRGKGAWKSWVSQMLAEGGEEGLSDMLNWSTQSACDVLFGTNASEWRREMDAYILANGLAPGEENKAFEAVFNSKLEELGKDIMYGAISGAPYAAAGTIRDTVNIGNITTESMRDLNGNRIHIDPNDTETVNALVEEGLSKKPGSRAYKKAAQLQTMLDKGVNTLGILPDNIADDLYEELVKDDVTKTYRDGVQKEDFPTAPEEETVQRPEEAQPPAQLVDDIAAGYESAGRASGAEVIRAFNPWARGGPDINMTPAEYAEEMSAVYNAAATNQEIPVTKYISGAMAQAAVNAAKADAIRMTAADNKKAADTTEAPAEYEPVQKTDAKIERDTERILDYVDELAGIGQDNFADVMYSNYIDDMDVSAYIAGAKAIYEAAQNGTALDDVKLPAKAQKFISEDVKAAMYDAAPKTSTTEEVTNVESEPEGEVSVPGRSEWNGSQNPSIESRQVAETAGRFEEPGRSTHIYPGADAVSRFTYADNEVTAADLDISKGDDTSPVKVITGGYTSEMESIVSDADKRGIKTVFFSGNNLSIDGGRIHARAMIDGDTMYVRADHPGFTVAQLANHELFHADIQDNREEAITTIFDELSKTYGQEYLNDVVMDAYRRLYDGADMDDMDIMEEVCADIAGNMDVFADTIRDLPVLAQYYQKFLESGQKTATEAAAKSIRSAAETVGETQSNKPPVVKYSSTSGETLRIKEQLRQSEEDLSKMDVVQTVNRSDLPATRKPSYLATAAADYIASHGGEVIEVQGFGSIIVSKQMIKDGIGYLSNDDEYAALLAIPRVLKRGIIIDQHSDHKGNEGIESTTFAAPIICNGRKMHMAVVVKSDESKNRYHVHRVLLPSGEVLEFSDNNKTEATTMLKSSSILKTSGSITSASNEYISQDNASDKPKYSMSLNSTNGDASIATPAQEDAGSDLRQRVKKLEEENRRLGRDRDYFKNQTKLSALTPGSVAWKNLKPVISEYNAKKILRAVQDLYGSTASVSQFVPDVQRLVTLLATRSDGNTFDDVNRMLLPIAKAIVSNTQMIIDDDGSEILKDIRSTTIKVGPRVRADIADFDDWRKAHLGRMRISYNTGTDITEFYQQLTDTWGENYFPSDILNGSDQLQYIADFVDHYQPITQNPYSYDMASLVQDAALSLYNEMLNADLFKPTYADRQNARIQKMQDESQQRVQQVREAARQQKEEQIQKIKAHYREVAETRRARKQDRDARKELLKIARRLDRMKTTRANKALINDLIGDLDLVAITLTDGKAASLAELNAWYEEQKETNPEFVARHDLIGKQLARLSQKKISEMSLEDVQELTNALKVLENTIRNDKKMIGIQDSRDTLQMGMQIIRDIDNAKGTRKGTLRTIDNLMIKGTLSPTRFMHRLTGYVESDPLYQSVSGEQGLAGGQRRMLDYQMRAGNLFTEWLTDKKFMKRLTGTKAEILTYDILTADGKEETIQLTPDMRMLLYLASKDQGWMRHMCGYDTEGGHIAGGGITLPDMKSYRRGNLSDAYSGGTKTVKLTRSFLNKLANDMTEQERAFADAIHDYFNGMSKDAINAVSEQLLGRSIAEVGDYLPISVDKNFLGAEYGALKMDGTIEGMGNLKERINSNKPVMVRDLTSVLKQSIESTSKYVGLAIPIRNFNKLMGVTVGHVDENGVYQNYETSVLKIINDKWGESAQKYIENMITDLQMPSRNQEELEQAFAKIRSKYAGAVLTLNASVALKQAASYPTAAAILGWKPLMQAMGKPGHVDLEFIAKWTPLQWYRTQGFSTQELGDIKNQNNFFANLPKGLNWIQGVDLLTTRKLWKAAEFYVRDNNPELYKQGAGERGQSDEFYRAVAEIYNKVIEETQPNYTALQRPEYLRSKSGIVRTLMMFKTQPMQNFNVLYDAIGNYRGKKAQLALDADNEEIRAQYKEAGKNLRRAVSSQVAQLITFATMTMLWNMFRRKREKYTDEEGNISLEKIGENIGKDTLSGLFSMVPFGSDLWSFASSKIFGDKYYGFESVTDSAIGDFIDGVSDIWKLFDGSLDDGTPWFTGYKKKMKSIASAVSKVFGVPVDNVYNTITALYMRGRDIQDEVNGTHVADYYAALWTEDPSKDKTEFYRILYDAYINGYEDDYEAIRADMIESGEWLGTDELTPEEEIDKGVQNVYIKDITGGSSKQGVYDYLYSIKDTDEYQTEYDHALQFGFNEEDISEGMQKSFAADLIGMSSSTYKNADLYEYLYSQYGTAEYDKNRGKLIENGFTEKEITDGLKKAFGASTVGVESDEYKTTDLYDYLYNLKETNEESYNMKVDRMLEIGFKSDDIESGIKASYGRQITGLDEEDYNSAKLYDYLYVLKISDAGTYKAVTEGMQNAGFDEDDITDGVKSAFGRKLTGLSEDEYNTAALYEYLYNLRKTDVSSYNATVKNMQGIGFKADTIENGVKAAFGRELTGLDSDSYSTDKLYDHLYDLRKKSNSSYNTQVANMKKIGFTDKDISDGMKKAYGRKVTGSTDDYSSKDLYTYIYKNSKSNLSSRISDMKSYGFSEDSIKGGLKSAYGSALTGIDYDEVKTDDVYDYVYGLYSTSSAQFATEYQNMINVGYTEKAIKDAIEKRLKAAYGVDNVKKLPFRFEAPDHTLPDYWTYKTDDKDTGPLKESGTATGSSWIGNYSYNNGALTIYENGVPYTYYGVPEEVYEGFKNAQSKGSYVNNYIKGKYSR